MRTAGEDLDSHRTADAVGDHLHDLGRHVGVLVTNGIEDWLGVVGQRLGRLVLEERGPGGKVVGPGVVGVELLLLGRSLEPVVDVEVEEGRDVETSSSPDLGEHRRDLGASPRFGRLGEDRAARHRSRTHQDRSGHRRCVDRRDGRGDTETGTEGEDGKSREIVHVGRPVTARLRPLLHRPGTARPVGRRASVPRRVIAPELGSLGDVVFAELVVDAAMTSETVGDDECVHRLL